MTLGQILAATEPLKKVLECPLPVKTAFRVGKFINEIQPALSAYEEARKKIVTKYGTETDDGGYKVGEDNRFEFTKELNLLLEEKLECDVPTLNLDDLNGVQLTPIECSNLAWLIVEE